MADHLPREFLDELRKKATPAHVAQYVTREMPPDTQWRPFEHLMLVNRKIVEACTSDEQTFLNIAISVRHGKSELISRYLPVWYLGMYPDRQVVIVSYNESKAAEWGAFARDVFKQYGPELFGLTVDTETSSKTEWKIKGRRGGMRSVGVNGSLTGIGADLCMASGTLVSTPIGQVEIDTLAREGGTVWAYDFASKSARPARITGATESSAPRLVQVTFTSGRVLRCTPEHPVYSLQRGWIGAGDLTAQDEVPLLGDAPMRSVRGRSDASRVRVGQVGQGGAEGVLLEEVRERGAPQAVRRLRGADRGTAPSVLSALCVSSQERVEAQACGQDVPGVLDAVPPSVEPDAVLLSGLRGCRPLKADDRHRELALQGRVELLQGLQGGAASGPPTGRPEVRRVWRHATPSGPPSGRGRDEQPAGEPHHPVQRGPHEAPQVSRDTVALVEHLPGTGHTVYDIEVEGLHNFFAGDLLVHNCIIDDPIKNREEADSATARANMFSWYGSTLRTRLMPHGTMILTMARWHSDDLTGMIERAQAENEGGDPWEKVNLPALAEPPKDAPEDWRDILGRAPGEALWPEVWPKEKLLQIKASILGSDWDSLYQQNPTPAEGGMFKVDAWRYTSGRPPGLRLCRAWDLAATQDGGDWTVGALVGMTADNRVFVCDIVRAQLDSAGVKRLVLDTAKLDGRLVPIRIEQERAGAGKSQVADYKRLLIGYDVRGRKPEGTKEQRAAPYASQQQESNVYLVDADRWGPAFVEEHRRFPKGRHDDQCLVAGTLVETPSGPVSIEDVEVGDLVLGASGWVSVESAGMTGVCPVRTVGPIRGTEDHPVWTDRGWVSLWNVRHDDRMLSWSARSTDVTDPPRRKDGATGTTARGGTTEIPKRHASDASSGPLVCAPLSIAVKAGSSSGGCARPTTPGGGGPAAPTASPPSPAPCESSKSPSTESPSAGTPTPRNGTTSGTSPLAAPTPRSGSSRSTARSGSTTTEPSLRGGTSTTLTATGTTTTSATWRPCPERNTSPTIAAGQLRTPSALTSIESGISLPHGTAQMKVVPGIGSTHAEPASEPVFNLRTADGTYFANGILVHNCDATASAFEELAQVAPVVITSRDEVSEVPFDRLMQAGFGRPQEFTIPVG